MIEIQLRWEDFDRFGHVNNAKFLTLIETARAHLFSSDPRSNNLLDQGVVVAHLDVDFLRPLTFQLAPIFVQQHITRIGNSSFHLQAAVWDESESTQYLSSTAVMVATQMDTGSSRPLNPDERACLTEWMKQ